MFGIIKYLKKKRSENLRKQYEQYMNDLHKSAAELITIRNVEFKEENITRPCLLIDGNIAYIDYDGGGAIDIMGMMLDLRDKYVQMYKNDPTIILR